MIEADTADYSRPKLDHDLPVSITIPGITCLVNLEFVTRFIGSGVYYSSACRK